MSLSIFPALLGAVTFASQAYGHGVVNGIVADGVYYEGYSPSFQFRQTQPMTVGWSIPQDLDTGFVAPDAYSDDDIICHKGAANAKISAKVSAGGTVELQWNTWPDSHHGPVIDYLANCNGDCAQVDKTKLNFFKIDAEGLVNGDVPPGEWASDTLMKSNFSWTVTIPKDIAPGNYVLRHEIVSLHSAHDINGAQNYSQCVNLEISGSGTSNPAGVPGIKLYDKNDPGIFTNIYTSMSTYTMPGPSLYSGAVTGLQTAQAGNALSPATAAVPSPTPAAVAEPDSTPSPADPASSPTVAAVAEPDSAPSPADAAPPSGPAAASDPGTGAPASVHSCKKKRAPVRSCKRKRRLTRDMGH